MAEVVFECPLDELTLTSINDLRLIRRDVLKRQIKEIDAVVATLLSKGVFPHEERNEYKKMILEDLRDKCAEIEIRLRAPKVVYSDEIELYIDVLGQP